MPALVAALLLIVASPAIATEAILLAAPPGDPVAVRIAAELGALGFQVVLLPGAGAAGDDPFARAVEDAGVRAALRMPGPDRIELWTVSEAGPRLREALPVAGEPDAADALRAVETVRAALLTLPPPTLTTRAAPAPRPPVWSLALGPGVAVSGGGVGWSANLTAALEARIAHRLVVTAHAHAPLAAATAGDARGVASVRATIVGVGAAVPWHAPGAPLRLVTGAGVAGAAVQVAGTARDARFIAADERVWTALPHLRATAAWSASAHFGLRGDLSVGWAAPRVRIAFDGHGIAAWGRPLLALSLMAEAAW